MRSISPGIGYILLFPYFTIAFAWVFLCLIVFVLNELTSSVNAYFESADNFMNRYVDLNQTGRVVFRVGLAKSSLIVILGWLGSFALIAVLYWINH